MNITSATGNEKDFKAFLGKLITIEFNEYIFDLQSVYDLDNFDDFLLVKDNGKIVDFINIYNNDGFDFIAPNFTSYDRQLEELHLLKYTYPNHILECSDYYLNPEQKEYYKCKFNSRVNRNYIYITEDDTNFYVTTEKKTNVLRDAFEENYFSKLNLKNLKFINLKCNDLAKFLKQYNIVGTPLWTNGKDVSIAGFHYLSLEDSMDNNSNNSNYLLCLNENSIVGVIKHGILNEENIKHQCMFYIDVNFAYRKQGISKILINQMNKHLEKDLPFVITNETEIGKKCKMKEHFKSIIEKPVYTYKELELLKYEEQIKDLRNR